MSGGAKHRGRQILFRCDGTAQTGLGHASRCLALAEALTEAGCECHFAGHWNEAGRELVCAAGMSLAEVAAPTGSSQDAVETAEMAGRLPAAAIVADSYEIDANYLNQLQRGTTAVILIDDFARLPRYPCHALVNFTVNARALPYPKQDIVCLLGPEYFFARHRLRQLRAKKANSKLDNKKICVAIGGVDRHDLSFRVIEALLPLAGQLAVRVVVSKSHPGLSKLEQLLQPFRAGSSLQVQLPDLSEIFAWTDLCFCGGGLTKYEAAYLGIPTAVISQTEDQAGETIEFARRGLAVDFGLGTRLDTSLLSKKILDWLADSERHLACRRAALLTFPADPTRNAAEALVKLFGA